MNQDNNFNNQNTNNGYNQNSNMNYNQSSNQNYNNVPVQNNNQKEEPKKGNNVLLILFMVISLLLAGYIVYDKALKKEEVKEPEKIVVEEKEQLKKVEVINAYKSEDELLVVPKLDGNSNGILDFNKKIENRVISLAKLLKDALEKTNYFEEKLTFNYEVNNFDSVYELIKSIQNLEDESLGKKYSFSTYNKDGLIALKLEAPQFCQASCGPYVETWYFYDTNNDREISYKEAAKKFNATENGKEVSNYNLLPDGCYKINIDSSNNMDINAEGMC